MKNTFKILFYIRKEKENKKGEVPIFCRLTVSGTMSRFSLNITIPKKLWDEKSARASGRCTKSNIVNTTLESYNTSLNAAYSRVLIRENYVTAELVRNEFFGTNLKNSTLMEVFAEHNDNLKKLEGISVTKATVQKYNLVKKHILSFMKYKYNITDINLRGIDHSFICELEIYMRTVVGHNQTTLSKFMKFFRKIIIIALKNGWIVADPFANYKLKTPKVDRGYLTEQELRIIMNKKFEIPRLEHVRDIFIFSCFTGLSYIDAKKLLRNEIVEGFDGNLWIDSFRGKTKVDIDVPLLEIPLKILQKYEAKMKNKDYVLPVLSNQKMNSYLKEIAACCEIDKNITFHMARHTFATTVTLSKGVPIETVSKLLGHTNIKTTQIYARIVNTKVSEDMAQLGERLKECNM